MTETPAPSGAPSDYPILSHFFSDETPLDQARRELLIKAAREAMESTMTAHLPDSPLACEIRQCVEDLKLCPTLLEENEKDKRNERNKVAANALREALNSPKIRPIVEMVWDQLKRARSPGGTILVDHL